MASVFDVAQCLLYLDEKQEGDGISHLKLQKLAYYCQGFFLALFDRPLFNENIEAWQHGPVCRDLYQEYKKFGSNRIELASSDFDPEAVLGEEEFGLVEEVYQVFGQFTAWKLRDMTHEEAPWREAFPSESSITPESMKAYFRTQLN